MFDSVAAPDFNETLKTNALLCVVYGNNILVRN